jgi:hypothetical protein
MVGKKMDAPTHENEPPILKTVRDTLGMVAREGYCAEKTPSGEALKQIAVDLVAAYKAAQEKLASDSRD